MAITDEQMQQLTPGIDIWNLTDRGPRCVCFRERVRNDLIVEFHGTIEVGVSRFDAFLTMEECYLEYGIRLVEQSRELLTLAEDAFAKAGK